LGGAQTFPMKRSLRKCHYRQAKGWPREERDGCRFAKLLTARD
jgi:hypothetical protein